MKVKDCMCNTVIYTSPETSVCDCANLMKEKHVGCIPICDMNNNVVGVITDRDIVLRCIPFSKDTKNVPVSEIMTTNVCCCESQAELEEAENLMKQNNVRRLPIIENNKIVGILTLGDLASNTNVKNECVGKTLEGISNSNKNNS